MKTDSDEIRRRIIQVVDLVFAGSQRSLAQAVEMSPALVSRVVLGSRPPSKKLLQALAKLPQINAKWLETGKGNPIHVQPQILTDIGAVVPVARQLLTRPLLESEDLLSLRFISVPRAFYSATSYAIQLKSCNCDQIFLKKEFLKLDDMLVIETSPDRLREAAALHFDRLRVMYSAEFGAVLAVSESDFFQTTGRLHPSKRDKDVPKTVGGRKLRAIRFDDEENNLNVKETHGRLPVVRDQDESPTVAGVVTLSLREYRVE